ncbi:uncharacterized protein J4E84_010026 [Alternaria hordeiaustralica]|uniref:uncharacterized protein n=1 Tax=Alternaria hordeiaustralica TaxID=1187925 RepID=UPI0020C402AD|nr:uncharacterized protein J4E84_010026 [Alternaria hordeiaustralica]KAI4675432.1 hypothetical protein J4E84_010026 [Alternaria hordeiaustralica]
MSATGNEPPSLDTCPQGKHLVAFAQRTDILIKICVHPTNASPGSVYVPRELLRSVYRPDHSEEYRRSKSGELELLVPGLYCSEVLGLFVQWLYVGKYTELGGLVIAFNESPIPNLTMYNTDRKDTMEWAVKAAILAWLLGDMLQIPGFQNYAMERLLAALARKSKQPQLTLALCLFVWGYTDSSDVLDWVLMDLVIRNWGDAAVVDLADLDSWFSFISDQPSDTRVKFMEGTLMSLEKRREKVLVAQEYLV